MTTLLRTVTRDAAVAQLLSAINTASASATAAQRDTTVEGILKQMNQGRFKACEHLIAVGFNLIDRGSPLEQVEEPGHRYVALMRSRHAMRLGTLELMDVTLGSLILAERLAHAEREKALALFLDDRSYYRATQLLTAAAAYERANARFVDFIRQKAVETEGPRLAVARTT